MSPKLKIQAQIIGCVVILIVAYFMGLSVYNSWAPYVDEKMVYIAPGAKVVNFESGKFVPVLGVDWSGTAVHVPWSDYVGRHFWEYGPENTNVIVKGYEVFHVTKDDQKTYICQSPNFVKRHWRKEKVDWELTQEGLKATVFYGRDWNNISGRWLVLFAISFFSCLAIIFLPNWPISVPK